MTAFLITFAVAIVGATVTPVTVAAIRGTL